MPVLYANNAASRLAASITNVATSFSVTAGHGAKFPAITGGDYFYATLMDSAGNLEVVKVTARATDTFTVARAQEGTTARAYSVNDIVDLRITKLMLDDFKTDTRTGNFVGQLFGAATGAPDAWIWSVSPANPTWGIFYNEGTPDAIEFKAAGSTTASIFLDTGAATFGSTVTAPTFSGALSGNASTATNVAYSGLTGTVPTWNQNTTGNAATATSSPLLSALGSYAWSQSTLPTSYSAGIQSAFVGPASLQLYVPYGPSNGGTGLQVRFGDYNVSSGNAWTAWKTLLASDNFNSYSPTLTGTGASGSWGISITGTAAVSTAATVTTSATASAFKVPFANTTANTTGNYGLLQDSEGTFTYNPSTNTLTVGTVSGALSGNATTATTATNVSGGTANVASLTVNSNNISAVNSLGFRNRIINGDMEINQRGAGAVLVTTANNGVKTVDRWFCGVGGTAGITFQQVVDGPTNGPKYSLKMTTTTAWTGTGQEGNHIFQWIENSNVLDFKYGTAQANSCTVSFWVKSSLTGSFSAFMYTNGGTASASRTIVTPFTISAANTWEFKTITFVGDVTGSGYATIADNGAGLLFGIDLGSGTGRNTSTTNTWQQVDDVRTSSTPGILPTSGATMNLTGVQLEAGIVATPFERIDYGRKLFMCQRYYFNKYFSIFISAPAESSVAMLNYPAYMRATPTTTGVPGFTLNVSYFTLDGQGTTNTRVVMGSTFAGVGEWTGFISAESEM
jgi:hypothetical protein